MENKKSKERGLSKKFTPAALSFARLSVLWLGIILVLTIFELIYNGIAHQFPKSFFGVLSWAFFNDLIFWFKGLIYFFVIFVLLHLISGKLARITYCVFIVFMALVQVSLTSYFTTALVPLGADLYGYSMADIKQTVGAAGGVSILQVLGFAVLIGGIIFVLWKLPQRFTINRFVVIALPLVSLILLAIGAGAMEHSGSFISDFDNSRRKRSNARCARSSPSPPDLRRFRFCLPP